MHIGAITKRFFIVWPFNWYAEYSLDIEPPVAIFIVLKKCFFYNKYTFI